MGPVPFHEEPKIVQVAGSERSRNVTFRVRGRVYTEKDSPASSFEVDLKEPGLKLTSILWLIQEKLGLYLWVGENEILMPMESRNGVRFDTPCPVHGPKIFITPFNLDLSPVTQFKAFFLILDFDR